MTRLLLPRRLFVEKRRDETKKAQGRALTDTVATWDSVSGTFDINEKAYLTSMPAEIMIMGMKIAQRKPMTDCLYFMRISRQVMT